MGAEDSSVAYFRILSAELTLEGGAGFDTLFSTTGLRGLVSSTLCFQFDTLFSATIGQVGGRQVDGDALVRREGQPAVVQGGPHPLPGFLDFGVRQADHRERRQAVGEVDFDGDGRGGQAVEGPGVDGGEAHPGTVGGRPPGRPAVTPGRNPNLHLNGANIGRGDVPSWCVDGVGGRCRPSFVQA